MSGTELHILMLQKIIDHHPALQTPNNLIGQTPWKGQWCRAGWTRATFEALTAVGRLFEQIGPMFI